jgi:hypothetical protein
MERTPRRYVEFMAEQAYRCALLGATDKQIAGVIGVDINTFDYFKRNRPEFLEALNRGKMDADAKVAEALYRRAIGYEVEEVDIKMYRGEIIKTTFIKHYPPDSWAAVKWLTIRQRTHWADIKVSENLQANININKFDFSELTTEELKMIKSIGLKQIASGTASDN